MIDREAFEKWAEDKDFVISTPVGRISLKDAAWEVWQAAQAQAGKPIAAVTGWHDGRCVIEPLDRALAIPVGMALYSQPQALAGDAACPHIETSGTTSWCRLAAKPQVHQQLLEALKHIMKMQTFGYIVLGEEATTKARAAIAAAQEEGK